MTEMSDLQAKINHLVTVLLESREWGEVEAEKPNLQAIKAEIATLEAELDVAVEALVNLRIDIRTDTEVPLSWSMMLVNAKTRSWRQAIREEAERRVKEGDENERGARSPNEE